MWIIRVYINHFLYGWIRKIMRKTYKLIGLGVILFAYLFTISANAYASTQLTPAEGRNEIISQGLVGSAGLTSFGNSTGFHPKHIGFKYTPTASHYVCQVDFTLRKNGNPTDFVKMSVYEGGSSMINGDLLNGTSAFVWSGTEIATTGGIVSFPLSDCIALSKTKYYWFTLSRTVSGGEEASDYYYYYSTATDSTPNDEIYSWSESGEQTGYHNYGTMYGIGDGSLIDFAEENSAENVCDNTPDLVKPFCQATYKLLVPNSEDINTDVASMSASLNEKVPFAYILEVFNIGDELSATNSATPTFINIPYSSSSVSALFGVPQSIQGNLPEFAQNYFNILKTAISFIMWALFLTYLIVRFRHKLL